MHGKNFIADVTPKRFLSLLDKIFIVLCSMAIDVQGPNVIEKYLPLKKLFIAVFANSSCICSIHFSIFVSGVVIFGLAI